LRQPRRHLWIDALLGIPSFIISYLALYQIAPRMSVYGPLSAGVVAAFVLPAIHYPAFYCALNVALAVTLPEAEAGPPGAPALPPVVTPKWQGTPDDNVTF